MGGELLEVHVAHNTSIKKCIECNSLDLQTYCPANGVMNIEKLPKIERLVFFNIVLINCTCRH